jgi:hypothetical protein
MDGKRNIRRIDEGDFLQALVSQNATLALWPAIVKASAGYLTLSLSFM